MSPVWWLRDADDNRVIIASYGGHTMGIRTKLTFAACLAALLATSAPRADVARPDLEKIAATMAKDFSGFCPSAAKDDVAAHMKCSDGLRHASFVPFARTGILFGNDTPEQRISKRPLTHLQSGIFQLMYLSLFVYTGKWSVGMDAREHVPFIALEAYFRNAMPPGEYPYPFWHSAAKWNAYETANELKFYLDHDGKVFVVTRSQNGSEAARGPYAHVTPPAFDGNWQWQDASGHVQPHASLFSNRYSTANPYLPALDNSYRAFALQARQATCLNCHTPENKADMTHLVLLQTPVHASGEIDDVLKQVRNGDMPQDDLGLKADIKPDLRAALLKTGEAFRQELHLADQWEVAHPH